MPLCMACKKQYPFGTVYCPVCGKRLVIGKLRAKPDEKSATQTPTIIQKEIITEVEVIYCAHCGTKNSARLAHCSHCGASLR